MSQESPTPEELNKLHEVGRESSPAAIINRIKNISFKDNYEHVGRSQSNIFSKELVKRLNPQEEADFSDRAASRYLKNKLKDSLVIDFGCGVPGSVMYSLEALSRFDIGGYIGVDPFNVSEDEDLSKFLESEFWSKECPGAFDLLKAQKVLLKKIDILSFLKALPDDCCHIMMNGIDETILVELSKGYLSQLKKEINRVVKPGGLLFGIGSGASFNDVLPGQWHNPIGDPDEELEPTIMFYEKNFGDERYYSLLKANEFADKMENELDDIRDIVCQKKADEGEIRARINKWMANFRAKLKEEPNYLEAYKMRIKYNRFPLGEYLFLFGSPRGLEKEFEEYEELLSQIYE